MCNFFGHDDLPERTAETALIKLMDQLAGDCKLRDGKRPSVYDRCGAFYPDLASPLPPDEPRPAPIRSKLRLVE